MFKELFEGKHPYKEGDRFYVNEPFATSYRTINSNSPFTVKEGAIIRVLRINKSEKVKYGYVLEGVFVVESGFNSKAAGTSKPTISKIDTSLMVED